MAYSQNGYKANDRSLIASYTIPGTKVRVALRKGDVSVVLLHFAEWFNKNIEALRQSDTGGYAERTIRGSSKTLSNHASGTAIDLRWRDHPLGARNTFSNSEENKIRAQLATYDGVIRWGGDYSGRKDEMHFEINKNKAAVAEVVAKLKGRPKPQKKYPNVPPHISGRHNVTTGHYGTDVVDIQWAVGATADGRFGPKTKAAVIKWQKSKGLVGDGIVGDKTWRKLGFPVT